jgi:acyl-CoA hydrolase
MIKTPQASSVIMTQMVLPPDTNAHGTVFGGRVMGWMDIAAAISAERHARKNVVTVSVDALHFIAPAHLGYHITIKAMVNAVYHSSMEVGVRVEAENPISGEVVHTSSAYFTFVALDATGKPTGIPTLQPQTPEEIRRHEAAQKRRHIRLINKKPPVC